MKKKNIATLMIFLLALLICVACAIYIGKSFYDRRAEQNKYVELASEAVKESTASTYEKTEEIHIPQEIMDEALGKSIDFTALQERNDELIAWVWIPNTNIDYPIAMRKSDDQDFYLKHDIDREEAYAGSIYMEYYNSENFTDFNTIIYGHNMKNGSMFKTLHLFEEKEFFDSQRYFYVYTPGHVLVYEIFGAYDVDDGHILTKNNYFFETKDREDYIETNILHGQADSKHLLDSIKLDADSNIVTMSTCIGGQPDRRYIVQGVLKADVESSK